MGMVKETNSSSPANSNMNFKDFPLPALRRLKPQQLVNWIAKWYHTPFTSKIPTRAINTRTYTLPSLVDKIAIQTPERVFAIIPSYNPEFPQGWQSITFQELVGAVNFTCCWIEQTIGHTEEAVYVAYLGGNDIRYAVFILACMKTGYIPLLLSPRNSETAHQHLMNVTGCEELVYSEERQSAKDRVETAKPSAKHWMIPTLAQMLDTPVSFGFQEARREHENDVVLALHSSGTTGLPKLVNLTNGYLQSVNLLLGIPKPPGRQLALRAAFKAGPSLSTAPFFHIMGLYSILESIFHGLTFVLYPEGPITEEGVLSALSTSKPRSATFAPSSLEDLSGSDAFLNEISKLDVIFYAGAALSPDVGTRLTQRTNVVSIIGSTETGVISSLVPTDRENWNYFEWNPEYDIQMQSIGHGLYELVIPRPKTRDFHGVFHTYPDAHEYRTKDIFSPHPRHLSLWKAETRLDDVIVLSNGEKINPVNMERTIERNLLVSRALVVGQGRFLPGVLLELHWALVDENDSDDQLIQKSWQSVSDANKHAPDYAQLSKSHVLVASKDRPFQTTSKGSINRRATVTEYAADIDRLFAKSEEISLLQEVDWSNHEQVALQINRIVSDLLSVPELSDEQDFFSLGMDSLQVLRLVRMLQGAVRSLYDSEPKPDIRSQDIYAHPTIRQLGRYMQSLRPGTSEDLKGEIGESVQDRTVLMEEIIKKYTQNILPPSIQRTRPSSNRTVLLTGSTGTLGNYLLYGLGQDPDVSKIICLVRDAGAEDRQGRTLKERGLVLRSEANVQYLVAHLNEPNLGLELETYRSLARTVDVVIHNAWKVNFAEKIESFEPHIQGVRRLIDLCLESTNNPRLHFVSSIESVGQWNANHTEPIPEDTVLDSHAAVEQGYSESKFVAERICDIVASRSNLSVGIHRVGQLGGPTTKLGQWNPNEWVPSIIKTSKAIGLVPQTLGSLSVNWIPVDTLASILLEIITGHSKQYTENRAAYFNLVNPSTTSWETLLPAVTKAYGVKPVGFKEWLDVLDQIRDPSEDDYTRMPALKVLNFYKELQSNTGNPRVNPSTEHGRRASHTMRDLEPITESLMGQWIKQWNF